MSGYVRADVVSVPDGGRWNVVCGIGVLEGQLGEEAAIYVESGRRVSVRSRGWSNLSQE